MASALLAHEVGEQRTSDAVAAGAARACEKLCAHLARIVGETGIRALFDRSLTISTPAFPWLPPPVDGVSLAARWTALTSSLAAQPPAAALEGAASVVATLIRLVGRFIGDDLTMRLLQELEPEDAPPGTFKETT
jgi:hypothetical protein